MPWVNHRQACDGVHVVTGVRAYELTQAGRGHHAWRAVLPFRSACLQMPLLARPPVSIHYIFRLCITTSTHFCVTWTMRAPCEMVEERSDETDLLSSQGCTGCMESDCLPAPGLGAESDLPQAVQSGSCLLRTCTEACFIRASGTVHCSTHCLHWTLLGQARLSPSLLCCDCQALMPAL